MGTTASIAKIGIITAGAAIVLGGGSGAIAASLVTSADIKNQTIQSRDISSDGVGTSELRNDDVQERDLSPAVREQLGVAGPQGEQGIAGPSGADGVDGEDGARGPRGLRGFDGPGPESFTFKVGTDTYVCTDDNGVDPTEEVADSDLNYDCVITS